MHTVFQKSQFRNMPTTPALRKLRRRALLSPILLIRKSLIRSMHTFPNTAMILGLLVKFGMMKSEMNMSCASMVIKCAVML